MASPQKENGYTPIANELLEKLGSLKLLGSEFQVIFCIFRKTYGWSKKEDRISLSQFEKFTKLSRPTVVSVLKNMIENCLIVKENESYKFNKNWEEWGGKAGLTSKAGLTRTSKHRLTDTSKAGLTHKRKKEIKTNSTSTFVEDAYKNKSMKNSFKYNENQHTDTFEDSIDIDTGEYKTPKVPKRQKAINYIKNYFMEKCEKKIGIKPMITFKQNIIIANLYKKGLKPSQIIEIIDWWFNTQTDKTKIIQIGICLSSYNINNYQVTTDKKI